MSKLKRYNQILLAIIGTITLLVFVVSIFIAGYNIYEEFTWDNEDQIELSVLSDERVEELVQDEMVLQNRTEKFDKFNVQ